MNYPSDPSPQKKNNDQQTPQDDAQTITTRQLFGAGQELLIDHAGEIYRLRITRNNKLILTK